MAGKKNAREQFKDDFGRPMYSETSDIRGRASTMLHEAVAESEDDFRSCCSHRTEDTFRQINKARRIGVLRVDIPNLRLVNQHEVCRYHNTA